MSSYDKDRRDQVSFDAYYFEEQQSNGTEYSLEQTFQKIYEINLWGSSESKSGEGTSESDTTVLKNELPKLFEKLDIKSVLDAPCGDLHWLSHIKLPMFDYIGVDILPTIIDENQKKHKGKTFIRGDLSLMELPRCDLILCRDLLVHLSFEAIFSTLKNFKRSGSTYLLVTTFPLTTQNEDIITGDWQPLNLQIPPFNLPAPKVMITEGCQQNDALYKDKSLGLWAIDDIALCPVNP